MTMGGAGMMDPGVSRTSHSYGYQEGSYGGAGGGSWAFSVSMLAGMLLGMVAAFEILQGIAAISKDQLYASTRDYVYKVDTTTWGWTHIVLGVLLTVVAIGILAQTSWGQVTGLIVAALSTVANFAFLPYYPVWSLTIIAINILIICALCSLLRADRPAETDPAA